MVLRPLAFAVVVLALAGVAHGDRARRSGLAVGPIMTGNEVGVRGGIDSGLLLIALERYDDAGRVRTRGEVALRIPVRLSRRIVLAPQLGVIPVDYEENQLGDRWLGFSASASARVDIALAGPISLVLEPLRVELGLAEITIPDQPRTVPEIERPWSWQARAFVGIRVGW